MAVIFGEFHFPRLVWIILIGLCILEWLYNLLTFLHLIHKRVAFGFILIVLILIVAVFEIFIYIRVLHHMSWPLVVVPLVLICLHFITRIVTYNLLLFLQVPLWIIWLFIIWVIIWLFIIILAKPIVLNSVWRLFVGQHLLLLSINLLLVLLSSKLVLLLLCPLFALNLQHWVLVCFQTHFVQHLVPVHCGVAVRIVVGVLTGVLKVSLIDSNATSSGWSRCHYISINFN